MPHRAVAALVKPAAEVLAELILKHVPANAKVLDLGGAPVPSPKLASRRIVVAREDEALALLQEQAAAPVDAVASVWPTRFAALIPLLQAARDALRPEGRLLLVDLVWQTAPTPELIRAFAPAAGREKVRPIEGYEMQIEHVGFETLEKAEVPRARWVAALPAEQRAAVEADARGAARLMAWVLQPRPSDE